MFTRFAIKDIRSQKFIFSILFLLFLSTSVAIFAGGVFQKGAKNGVDETTARLGADIIVVPAGYSSDIQNSLFEGEACTFDLDSSWTSVISEVDCVKSVSPERYIATLNADCCSAGGIQMIAYDPETDFTVNAWLGDQNIASPGIYEIIVGVNAGFEAGDTVEFFGNEFYVTAVLDETGMGYDSSAFISFDTAKAISSAEGYSMIYPVKDGVEQISMIMVEVEDDCDIAVVKDKINTVYGDDGIRAYSTTSLVSSLTEKISGVTTFITIFDVILIIVAVISVFAVVTINFYQRRTVIGRLFSVGVTPGKVIRIFFSEYIFIMIVASIIAIFAVILIMYPFEALLRMSAGIPYRQPDFANVLLLAAKTLIINFVVTAIASIYSAVRLIKREPAQIIKEDIT